MRVCYKQMLSMQNTRAECGTVLFLLRLLSTWKEHVNYLSRVNKEVAN